MPIRRISSSSSSYRNNEGKTALLDAVQTGRTHIVKLMVEKYHADYLSIRNDGCSALTLSPWEGHTEVLIFLLRTASSSLPRDRFLTFLNHRNNWGKTALTDAAVRGRTHIVRMLLEPQHGADYRLNNNDNHSALHFASQNGHPEIVDLLLKTASKDLPADQFHHFVNTRNRFGKTALVKAAEHNRPFITALLLDHGADYAISDDNDFTALHYSAWRNQIAAVRVLLEKTSKDRTTDAGKAKFTRFLNQQSKTNRATALRDAALAKHTDVARLILEYGPSYDPIDSGCRTALHQALGTENEELALAIVDYASRDGDKGRFRRFVEARDENGDSALPEAERRGFERVVRMMEERMRG